MMPHDVQRVGIAAYLALGRPRCGAKNPSNGVRCDHHAWHLRDGSPRPHCADRKDSRGENMRWVWGESEVVREVRA